MSISLEKTECDAPYADEKDALTILRAITACPDGVERMSSSIPGLVETSNNMAIVKVKDGKYEVKSLVRSSVDTAKEALCEKMKASMVKITVEGESVDAKEELYNYNYLNLLQSEYDTYFQGLIDEYRNKRN